MFLSLLIAGSSAVQASSNHSPEPSKTTAVTVYQEGGYTLYVQYTDPKTGELKKTGIYEVGKIFTFETTAKSYIYPHAYAELRGIDKIFIDGTHPHVKVKCWGTTFYPVCHIIGYGL